MKAKILFLSLWFLLLFPKSLMALPQDFVYLRQIDPSIQQDIRYATYHNFIGRPIDGYERADCILTLQTAEALKNIQIKLKAYGLSLKVYDCYRPQRAVNDFMHWSKSSNTIMKTEFYPNLSKNQLFPLGYIAAYSGHTRGSTVDLTLVPISALPSPSYQPGEKLYPCYAAQSIRFPDNSIDMGTGYDCLDLKANVYNKQIVSTARKNRFLLRKLMVDEGFIPYSKEWWHFTLKQEPYPNTYFNFPT